MDSTPLPDGTPIPTLSNRQGAADFLSVSTRTLDSWVKIGQVKPVKLGRLVRFHSDELRRVAREGIATTRSPDDGGAA